MPRQGREERAQDGGSTEVKSRDHSGRNKEKNHAGEINPRQVEKGSSSARSGEAKPKAR